MPGVRQGLPSSRRCRQVLAASERLPTPLLPAPSAHLIVPHRLDLYVKTERGSLYPKCPERGVKRIEVPWARPGSDFTLLFDQAAMSLVKEMPVLAVPRQLEISDKRLWRIVHHYVGRMLGELYLSRVTAVGVDETASQRGHLAALQVLEADQGVDERIKRVSCP